MGQPYKEDSALAVDPRLPVVIGVAGHRDLRCGDVTSLRESVSEVLQSIAVHAPTSPLLLLSPLAEGADRLVAEVALALGARLVVPLPMPQADYEHDFDSDSIAAFRALLGRASACFEVAPPSTDEGDFRTPGHARDARYRRAGAWVAVHSHVLIALWDGHVTGKVGGTGAIVRLRLEGGMEVHGDPVGPLDPIETGPVVHIVTPRVSGAPPVRPPFTWRTIRPLDTSEPVHGPDAKLDEAFTKHLMETERFNQTAQRFSSRLDPKNEAGSKRRTSFFQRNDLETLPVEVAMADQRYAIADELAIRFKNKSHRIFVAILGCAVIGVLALQVYLEIWRRPSLLVVYLAALTLTALLSLWANRRDYQTSHLQARAFAEALRVQLVWWLVGICDSPSEAYLRLQRPTLAWVRGVLRASEVPVVKTSDTAARERPLPTTGGLALARRCWVQEQLEYFTMAALRDGKLLHRAERASNVLFVSAMLAAIVVTVAQDAFQGDDLMWLHHALLIWLAMAIALAALIHAYLVWMVFAEQVRQYERMSIVFGRAAHALDSIDVGDTEVQTSLLRQLGLDALRENGWWLTLHRARPVEMFRG